MICTRLCSGHTGDGSRRSEEIITISICVFDLLLLLLLFLLLLLLLLVVVVVVVLL